MGSLAVVLSLCTVVAVGIVYFFTDNILLALLILAVGLFLAFHLDKKWRLDTAKTRMGEADDTNKTRILKDLEQLRKYKNQIVRLDNETMSSAVNNIYEVSEHILHDVEIDLKFINQVGLYLPRINKILDTYLDKSADFAFKHQSQEFMVRTSAAFRRLLKASGDSDMKEAEALMRALEETYRLHGHTNGDDKGGLL